MIASQEAHADYRDEIIHHYYEEFVKSLENIGFMMKPPNILDLNIELLKNGFIEVMIVVCFLPFDYLDIHNSNADVAFENGIEGLIMRKALYQDPLYKLMVTKVISNFLYKGFIN